MLATISSSDRTRVSPLNRALANMSGREPSAGTMSCDTQCRVNCLEAHCPLYLVWIVLDHVIGPEDPTGVLLGQTAVLALAPERIPVHVQRYIKHAGTPTQRNGTFLNLLEET